MIPYKKVLFYCSILTIAFFYVSVLSISTTYLYPGYPWGDSATFQVVGRSWAQGKLPYVDAWDLKGPFIFFINYLGYLIVDSKIGVFCVQVLFMSWTTCLIYKFYRIKFSKHWSYILLLLTLILLIPNYSAGNTVNEYCLPFLLNSFLLLYQWAYNNRYKYFTSHPPQNALWYGITFGLCLMSRLTNALGLCWGILFVLVVLLLNRMIKNLIANSAYFILGFIISAGPFWLFFAIHGASYEMWYGTLLFNMEHVGTSIFHFGIGYYIIHYGVCLLFLLIILYELFFIPQKRKYALLWLLSSLPVFIWYLNSNSFTHYAIIAIPYICIGLLELKDIISKQIVLSQNVKTAIGIILLLILVFGSLYHGKMLTDKHIVMNNTVHEDVLYSTVNKVGGTFVGYNVNPTVYLKHKVLPAYPYFTLQDQHFNQSHSFKIRLHDSFAQLKADWIMVRGENVAITEILQSNYALYQQEGDYALYHLKQ